MGLLRVAHVAGGYLPDSVGGTEVYIDTLISALRPLGVQSIVAAVRHGYDPYSYEHDGTPVYRYPAATNDALLYRHGLMLEPPLGFDVFERWLQKQRVDVFHQHSWQWGCHVHVMEAAKRRGLSVVWTVHIPKPVCLRDTMLLEGARVCDGRILAERCARCVAMAEGAPRAVAGALARVPPPWSDRALRWIGAAGASGVLRRGVRWLAGPAGAALHRAHLERAAELADRIVAPCRWMFDALVSNGVPPSKIALVRQGTELVRRPRAPAEPGARLRVGFVGRLTHIKGLHVLAQALALLPRELDVEVVAWTSQGDPHYHEHLQRLARGDARLVLEGALDRGELLRALSTIDLLAVPSQWLETGPLVVLEAFALGVPVIGSDLGGIRELVRHGENGLLVPHDDVHAWSRAMASCARDRRRIGELARGIGPVRTNADVAGDMRGVYEAVLAERSGAA